MSVEVKYSTLLLRCLLARVLCCTPQTRSRTRSSKANENMGHRAEKHHAAGLVGRGKGNGNQIKQSRDPQYDLDVGHGECSTDCCIGKRRERSTDRWPQGVKPESTGAEVCGNRLENELIRKGTCEMA